MKYVKLTHSNDVSYIYEVDGDKVRGVHISNADPFVSDYYREDWKNWRVPKMGTIISAYLNGVHLNYYVAEELTKEEVFLEMI